MPKDALVSRFDVVFKREPYADFERYDLSPASRTKIVATHLANPFLRHSTTLPARNRQTAPRRFAWQIPAVYDVGFLGSVQKNKFAERFEVWERVVASDLMHFGGLISDKAPIAAHLEGRKMGRPSYMK